MLYAPKTGDMVVLYTGRGEEMTPIKLTTAGVVQLKYGAFYHGDMVGTPYGSKIYTRDGKRRFMYMLAFTPELWTLSLPHRTQILYHMDIAMVVSHLNLRPGSRVVESGTGSGSLTHALARAVGPAGHVFTFEFNAMRAETARKEFAAHGLADRITVTHADACGDGFLDDQLADSIDGVFLDLPQPWGALPHAYRVLRRGGVVCSFSPCIEQVGRASDTLREAGFDEVFTIEALARGYEVYGDSPAPRAPGLDAFVADAATAASSASAEATDAAPAAKRPKLEEGVAASTAGAAPALSVALKSGKSVEVPAAVPYPAALAQGPIHYSLRASTVARGHTGYLTFGTLYRKKDVVPHMPSAVMRPASGEEDAL